tara:strand:+ start:377 stop:709 length:333 start_codon:yes stop_codon:yes gene_type:complete
METKVINPTQAIFNKESLEVDLTERYNEYTNLLKTNMCEVTFTKVNGEKRIMTCSLQKHVLEGAGFTSTLDPTSTPNMNAIACYDIKANGWRSFRVDSVTNFKLSEYRVV